MDNSELIRKLGTPKPIPSYQNFGEPSLRPIGSNSEILVSTKPFFNSKIIYDEIPELTKRGGLRLRVGIIKKLLDVQALLPRGFELLLYDGHRTLEFQQELVDYYSSLNPDMGEGYVSKTDNKNFAPPHTTGGAIDLTLTFQNKPLDLGTPYDSFLELSHIDALEFTELREELPSKIRRLLYNAMTSQGFAPYPLEWWHWSYGDQWWASFYDKPKSLYPTI